MMKLQLGPATPTHLDATTLKKKPKLLIFKIAPLNPSLSLGNRKRPHLCRRDEWMQLPPPKSNRHIKGSHRKRGHLRLRAPSPPLPSAPHRKAHTRAEQRREEEGEEEEGSGPSVAYPGRNPLAHSLTQLPVSSTDATPPLELYFTHTTTS